MKEVRISQVPRDANVISSHVLYKVKILDDGTMILKGRIAPQRDKDQDKDNLKTDSSTCPPVGIRILLSLCNIFKWSIAKVDVKSAFLQTGAATRNVYVIPPRECSDRSKYWLLLTAAYGLVNTNAKWQDHSDNFLRRIKFEQLVYAPQLFYMKKNSSLQILAVKIVDDILFAGPQPLLRSLIDNMMNTYELGTIVYGPGTFNFYCLSIKQNEDCTISINGDEKLMALEPYPIDRIRRRQTESELNPIEAASYRSLNGSIGFLGISASPFCSLASSYLQQRRVSPNVSDLVCQINMLRSLKKLEVQLRSNGIFPICACVF